MQLLLGSWEGPLAVLLHLIKTQALNIFNIPIVLITEQYLEFIDQAQDLDFDRAGDYLVMAAQLVEIKARFLLPALQNRINEEAQCLDEMSPDDPRKPLAEQLLAFQASLKEACEMLEGRPMLGRDAFPSGEFKRRNEEFSNFPAPLKGDPMDLVINLEQVLLRFANNRAAPRIKAEPQKVSLMSRMLSLKERFRDSPTCLLTDLMDECENRVDFIVSLMALLELAKLGQVLLEQHEPFGPLRYNSGPKFHEEIKSSEERAKPTATRKKDDALAEAVA